MPEIDADYNALLEENRQLDKLRYRGVSSIVKNTNFILVTATYTKVFGKKSDLLRFISEHNLTNYSVEEKEEV